MDEFSLDRNTVKTLSPSVDVSFHSLVTATGNGDSWVVGGMKNITISGIGTCSARAFELHGVDANGVDNVIMGVRGSDFSTATSVTALNETWDFSIQGRKTIYVKVTAVSGGNLTIKGNVTA